MTAIDPDGGVPGEPEGPGRSAGSTEAGSRAASGGGYPPPPGYAQTRPAAGGLGYGQAPAPGYSSYPGYGQPGPRHGGGMATAALVLGVLALLLCWTVLSGVILGLLSFIFGIIAARRARRGEAPGRGRAIAGIVTGILGLLLSIALIVIGVSIFNSGSGKTLQQCLQQAGSDQTAQQQCTAQFQKSISGG